MHNLFFTLPRKHFAIHRAQSFLKEKGNPPAPIPVKKHLKSLCTLYKFEDDQEEAFCVKELSGSYAVYINKNIIGGRDSWNHAHELAHIVLGHHDDFPFNHLNDSLLDLLDQEADVFVSEYLMPSYALEDYFFLRGRPQHFDAPHIGALKSYFNVSWEAMVLRLHNLGYQEKAQSDHFITTYNARKQNFVSVKYNPPMKTVLSMR